MATILFNAGIDTSKVSNQSRQVLSSLLDGVGCSRVIISSVCRTPFDQARIMHDNCVLHGASSQMDIYKGPGEQVVQVFIDSIHLSKDDTIAAMEAKIIALGPTTVSHHCSDPNVLEVFDLTDSSLGSFRDAVKVAATPAAGVSKVLDENGVLHVEIPQTA